jgi:hypothetical protein
VLGRSHRILRVSEGSSQRLRSMCPLPWTTVIIAVIGRLPAPRRALLRGGRAQDTSAVSTVDPARWLRSIAGEPAGDPHEQTPNHERVRYGEICRLDIGAQVTKGMGPDGSIAERELARAGGWIARLEVQRPFEPFAEACARGSRHAPGLGLYRVAFVVLHVAAVAQVDIMRLIGTRVSRRAPKNASSAMDVRLAAGPLERGGTLLPPRRAAPVAQFTVR